MYVIIISRTRLRVNLHSMVAWISRNFLLETDGGRTHHFEIRHPKLLPLIHENVKPLFSVKYNTYRNGNVKYLIFMPNVDLFQIKAFALVDKKSKIRGTSC